MRPDKDLEKSLNSIGLYSLDSLPAERTERKLFVEVAINPETNPELPNFAIQYVSKRGVRLGFDNFRVLEEDGQKKVAFDVTAYPPADLDMQVVARNGKTIGTSFIDICWNCGNEEVSADRLTTTTKLKPGAGYGDLGWHLPSRITDRLIDALGLLNATLFDGILEDAIIYAEV